MGVATIPHPRPRPHLHVVPLEDVHYALVASEEGGHGARFLAPASLPQEELRLRQLLADVPKRLQDALLRPREPLQRRQGFARSLRPRGPRPPLCDGV